MQEVPQPLKLNSNFLLRLAGPAGCVFLSKKCGSTFQWGIVEIVKKTITTNTIISRKYTKLQFFKEPNYITIYTAFTIHIYKF